MNRIAIVLVGLVLFSPACKKSHDSEPIRDLRLVSGPTLVEEDNGGQFLTGEITNAGDDLLQAWIRIQTQDLEGHRIFTSFDSTLNLDAGASWTFKAPTGKTLVPVQYEVVELGGR